MKDRLKRFYKAHEDMIFVLGCACIAGGVTGWYMAGKQVQSADYITDDSGNHFIMLYLINGTVQKLAKPDQ